MKRYILTVVTLLLVSLPLFPSTDRLEEIRQRLEVADSLHSVGRTDSAATVGAVTIEMAKESGSESLTVGALAAQGVFLRSLGKIDEALKNYGEALEIVTSARFRENPDQEAIEQTASLYINLAVLNLDMQHKEEAEKNAILSGEWIEKSSDRDLKSVIFGAAGSVLTGCGKLDKAMDFQKKAYENALAVGNKDAAFRAAAYSMLIADRLGDKKEAAEMRKRCEDLMPEIEAIMTRLVYYQAECSISLKNDNPREAIGWFDKILNLEGIDNLPFVKFDCYNNLHKAQAQTGDYKAAYSTLLKSNELRDSIWEEEKTESLRDLSVKYETKETQLALALSETRRANTLMWLFVAIGILLALGIIFILYASRQRRQRLQKEIEYANLRADIGRQMTLQYIEGLENERSRMSRELHDGVCNDLLAIQMSLGKEKGEENAYAMIESCRESVRRISHELMPPEFEYASIDEVVRFFIRKQQEANNGRITFIYESEATGDGWETVSENVALEVYRIVQEAVGNAVKHSGAGRIAVRMSLNEDMLELCISDDGAYKTSGKRGIGLESIRKRVAAINGTLEMKSAETGGTEVRVTVKR